MDAHNQQQPWWAAYVNDVTVRVRGQFEECRTRIEEASDSYWRRLSDFKKAPRRRPQEEGSETDGTYDPRESPTLLDDPLTVAGAWTLLAGVHDLQMEKWPTKLIGPPSADVSRKAGAFFDILKERIDDSPELYEDQLQEALRITPAHGSKIAEVGTSGAGRSKRSTEPGEGRAKLIAALTKHHQYSEGSVLNQEPIGNNQLAKKAGVSNSTASDFFAKEFGSHAKYQAVCRDRSLLVSSLKLLNGEFSPHTLYGVKPPGEGGPDDDDDWG